MNLSPAACNLRRAIKNKSQLASSGWLAEYDVCDKLFDILQEFQTDDLRLARSYEIASVDLLLLLPNEEQKQTVPPIDCSNDDLCDWAESQEDLQAIRIDVKYESLAPGNGRLNDKLHYKNRETCASHFNATDFYCVVFEQDDRHIALLPKLAWEHATDFAHGVLPLISQTPAFYHPFIIKHRNFFEAARRFLRSNATQWYVNPHNGAELRGFSMLPETAPSLLPTAERSRRPLQIMRKFMRKLRRAGARVASNRLAPLIHDFFMLPPKAATALRWEFKSHADQSLQKLKLEQDHRSPFHQSRQWHFLVCCHHGLEKFRVFARHEVDASWATEEPPEDAGTYFSGEHAYENLMEHVRTVMPQAINAANQVILQDALGSIRLDTLLSSNVDKQTIERVLRVADGDGAGDTKQREFHNTITPWICDQLNQIFRIKGKLVCLPLDTNHPVGNYMVVWHVWTSADKQAFDLYRRLPLSPADPATSAAECIILRAWDLTGAVGTKSMPYPIGVRRTYWKQSATKKRFFMLGCTQARRAVAERPAVSVSYAFIPSGFTTYHDQPLRQAPDFESEERYAGGQYFRWADYEDDKLASPALASQKPKVLVQGQDFMPPSGAVNPLRYLVTLLDVFESAVEVLSGPSDVLMSIRNPQSSRGNELFSREEYVHVGREVLEDMWDLQLTRQKNRKQTSREDGAKKKPASKRKGRASQAVQEISTSDDDSSDGQPTEDSGHLRPATRQATKKRTGEANSKATIGRPSTSRRKSKPLRPATASATDQSDLHIAVHDTSGSEDATKDDGDELLKMQLDFEQDDSSQKQMVTTGLPTSEVARAGNGAPEEMTQALSGEGKSAAGCSSNPIIVPDETEEEAVGAEADRQRRQKLAALAQDEDEEL